MSDLLQEDDIIELAAGHQVSVALPNHFCYENAFGCMVETSQTVVTIGEPKKELATDWLAGRYVVVSARYAGGGVAMGNDEYPDGWEVVCQRLMPTDKVLTRSMCAKHPLRVSFYQSGCFNVMNRGIVAVGRAQATWSEAS